MNTLHDVARQVFSTVSDGGTAIFRTDVGYAIVGHSAAAIRHIFAIKQRSFDKPCGCFGSWAIFEAAIETSDRARNFVDRIINRHNLPLSIVAPYRADHPIFRDADPFVIQNATKSGTVDLLMNAGPIHDEIARLVLQHGRGVFGSSANMSLTGSKYDFTDVETPLRDGVNLAIDSGATKYSNTEGYGSTIIDLATFEPFRIGICFPEIRQIAASELGIDIPDRVRS